MASSAEIDTVRDNTQETSQDPFSDTDIGSLIDTLGVDGASAQVWRRKAAVYQPLVNVTEAGATHSFGDLMKKALDMATLYDNLAGRGDGGSDGSVAAGGSGHVKVNLIERT